MILLAVVVRMFDDPFAHFEREVQPAERSITEFEVFHDAQYVQLWSNESPCPAQWRVAGLFSGMPEGRMPDVVDESQRSTR